MADFNPSRHAHAVQLPQAESLSQLYSFVISIREHLNGFTVAWAEGQPDRPQHRITPGQVNFAPSIGQFIFHRRSQTAHVYRDAVRVQLMRLWKPGLDPTPAQLPLPEEDLFNAIVPWLMSALEKDSQLRASQTEPPPSSPADPAHAERKKIGRPSDTDAKGDKRIYESWNTGKFTTYAEAARFLGTSEKEVRLALDRHRKRCQPQ